MSAEYYAKQLLNVGSKQIERSINNEIKAISIIEQKVKNAENLVIYYSKKMNLEKNDRYLDLIKIAQDHLIIYDNLLREINEAINEVK